MNNQELEIKVKELLEMENFFDMILAVKEFEKEYKNSDFFKSTKMPLIDVIKNAKMWYAISLTEMGKHIQALINSLDLSHLHQLIEKMGEVFQTENYETFELLKDFKGLGIVK